MKTNENMLPVNCLPVMDNAAYRVSMSVLPMRVLLFAALMMILLAPFNALAARQQFVLNFNDSQLSGDNRQPATLFLKKSLKQQYPWVKIDHMELRRVVLVAKSGIGQGGAQLRVGDRSTALHQVYGHPATFRDYRPYTFDRISFSNPAWNSDGPWHVDLRGNFIVRQVIVEVENHPRPHYKGGWRSYNR
jgi:hypothetical protein